MSHPQAFHTSCRNGLAAHPGFQFNAASPSLDRSLLSRLASSHAGYHVPRDMPLEPTPSELAGFPVSLKVAPVDGAGTVVSRTVYVGREFRGRDGSPDEGRFGNYFSHIVVGGEGEPFDGLLAIELWEAPHWVDTESPRADLSDLGCLEPGPLDVERVASLLATAPHGFAAAVLDAAVVALDGGPRLVLVEPDKSRAAAWIGWISYALPAAQARRLTFTTFDGRPRYADDVHVCVTTPACDIAFAAHELGHSVRLLDIGGRLPTERPSLYARVAHALFEQGTDALAAAVRTVPDDASGMRRGAWLAVAGALTELVEGDELASVVDLLRELAQRGEVGRAAATAKELPADATVDRATLAEWAALHRVARGLPADEGSRSLAATALSRIVAFAGELPGSIAPVARDTPTQPGVSNLAPWLSAVEAASGTAGSGPLVGGGLRLGLVGVNAAVDRRLARALSEGLAHPSVQDALRTIGRDPALDHIVVAVTEAVAERAEDDLRAREHLREMALLAVVRETLRRRAEEARSFERAVVWLQTEVAADPSRRRWAAGELAPLACSPRDEAKVRELWGDGGPRTDAEHVELLTAYLSAGVQPPGLDANRALAKLMSRPLTKAKATDALGATLARCDGRVQRHPSYLAWWVATTTPGTLYRFAAWAKCAGAAIAADEASLPEPRREELCPLVCTQVLRQRRAHDYPQGIAALRSRAGEDIDRWLVVRVAEALRKNELRSQLIADLFESWHRLPAESSGLVDDVLARATESTKRRDLEGVAEFLPPSLQEEWADWLERRPRSTVGRALGRLGRKKDAEDE